MKNPNPVRSVCIATYNGENFIEEQVASVLKQLDINDEIIISDDSSTDNTLKILESFNDKRVKIYSNQTFKSPIFNFENAIKQATGDIIFLADQDDVWVNGKVQIMCDKLAQGFDVVVSDAIITDENLKTLKESYFGWRNSRTGLIKNLVKNSYLGCCMAFKKEILEKVLPFPPSIPMHDMWIGIVSEVYFKPVFIKEKLMFYRRHNENATFLTESFESNESIRTQIKFRYSLIHNILRRALFCK